MDALLPALLSPGAEPALRAGTTRHTRSETVAAVTALVDRLRAGGVDENSCVLLRLANGPGFVVHLLAVLSSGAQVFVADHRLSTAALHRASALVGATHELVEPAALAPTVGFSTHTPVLQPLPGAGRRTGHPLIQLSSGTTGEPQVIGQSVDALLAELGRWDALGGLAPAGSSVVVGCSMASAWGLCGGLLAGLGGGLELVFPASLTARGLLDAVEGAERPCVLLGVPFQVEMLGTAPHRPGRLTRVVTSGATLDRERVERARAALGGVPVGQVYGMSEVGMIAADLRGEHPGTVGPIAPGVRSRVSAGGELELALPRSPYLEASAAPTGAGSARWADGWFGTRDAVSLAPSGAVTVHGRIDGLVNLGGRKFHVTEIEQLLVRDPSVRDALVFVDGGRIDAFVTLSGGPAFARDRVLAIVPEYMRPHGVHVVDALPRTPSGKIRRRRDLLPVPAGRPGPDGVGAVGAGTW